MVVALAKVTPVLYGFTSAIKKSFIQQDQDSEKEETSKKGSESSREKEFTFSNVSNKSPHITTNQTLHNTSYLNNYKSIFYGLITTPPPDVCSI